MWCLLFILFPRGRGVVVLISLKLKLKKKKKKSFGKKGSVFQIVVK